MLFIVYQLISLLLFVLLLSSLLGKNKILKHLLLFIGVLFIILEISSVQLGNALLDFKYYTHMKVNIVRGAGGFFTKEGIILLGLFILLFVLATIFLNRFSKKIRQKKLIPILLLLVSCGLMSMNKGVFANIAELTSLHFAKEKKFDEALEQLQLTDYVKKENLQATKGKNIIMIVLESVEESFLKDNFAQVTPNLRRLSQEMTYYNMKQTEGSSYTQGAIYTYLTGFPTFFKNRGNYIFDNSIALKINSISNALSVAGYDQTYLLGNPEFAGTRKMLNLMDVKVKSEADYDPKYTVNYWGLHDKDLFDFAKEEIKLLKGEKEPFSFYISTISTHPPNGILDPRMINEFPIQRSIMELMVASVDRHIGSFVQFLEEEELLDNTAIFILPDHLLMGNSAEVINEFYGPRDLYLITNTKAPSYPAGESILQMDIPKIVLEGAEVQNNMSFFTDYIKGDKIDFINKNKQKIIQLNEASLIAFDKTKNTKEKETKIPKKKKSTIFLKSNSWVGDNFASKSIIQLGIKQLEAKRGLNLLIYNGNNYDHEIFDTFNNKEEVDKLLNRLTELVEQKRYFFALVHDSAGDEIKLRQTEFQKIGFKTLAEITNRKAYLAISNYGLTSEKIRHVSVEAKLPFSPRVALRSEELILEQAKDRDRFIAHAGGVLNGETYTNSLEAMDLSYKKGFRVFELDFIKTSDGQYVAFHDWNLWGEKTGYPGNIPVDLKTFLKYRTVAGYTPMDMKVINRWFARHPDAVLVTDKVNDPERFVPQFKFPERLMMELFSFDAIEKAQQLKIKDAILSENMWQYLGDNKLEALQTRGIDCIAVSRRSIDEKRNEFKELKDAGIRIYGYHVGSDDLKDEAYMVREALDYCYGFYADDWSFN